MEPRYARNIPALTEEECALLRQKRVLVVGCGGLGGHIIDQLCRIGVGIIRAVDGDVFEPTNLNRQLLSDVLRLGISKAKQLNKFQVYDNEKFLNASEIKRLADELQNQVDVKVIIL